MTGLFLVAGGVFAILLAASWVTFPGTMSQPEVTDPSAPTLSSRDPTANLATRALKPKVSALAFTPDPEQLRQIQVRLAPDESYDLSRLMHALHLFGPEATVPARQDKSSERILDLLLDSNRATKHFGTLAPLLPTRYGARFILFTDHYATKSQQGTEAHPGQALSVLAGMGVPLAHPVRLPENKHGSLRWVLDDLKANIVLKNDICWDAVAVALYAAPDGAWENKFGHRITFDAIALEFLARPPNAYACWGTHRLISLTVLLRVDQELPILSSPVRAELRGHLDLVARTLTNTQRPDGYWLPDWYDDLPGRKRVGKPESDGELTYLHVTGHHLEWLMLLPDDLRPPRDTLASSARWLHQALYRYTEDRKWCFDNYCPVTHAARSVNLLAGREDHNRSEAAEDDDLKQSSVARVVPR